MFELKSDDFYLIVDDSKVVAVEYSKKEALEKAKSYEDPKILLAHTSEISVFGNLSHILK